MQLFKRRPADPVTRLMAAARLPTAGGPIPAGDVAMDLLERSGRRVVAVLAVVEELLAEGDDAGRVAVDFLEAVQNAVSHRTEGLLAESDVVPLCGPLTRAAWESIDQFWSAVVAWCDVTGLELDSADDLRVVAHSALMPIMWPTSRTLPDGRRVGLSEVVRYEKAVGLPMTAFGPHSD